MPYERLLAERVLNPLQLADTVVTPRTDQRPRQAVGHSRRRKPVPDWDLGSMTGAGALYSTVNDLLLLLRAHVEPSQCALPEAVALAQQPRATANRWLHVGLGWHVSALRGTSHSVLWHNGGTGGFFSFAAFVPGVAAGHGVGVAVLTNTARSVDRLGMKLLDQLVAAAEHNAAG